MGLKIDTTINLANVGTMVACLVTVGIFFGGLLSNQRHDHEQLAEVKVSMKEITIAVNGLSQSVAALTQEVKDGKNSSPAPGIRTGRGNPGFGH